MQYLSINYIKECLKYGDGKLYWLQRPLYHFPNEKTWKIWNSNFAYLEAGCLFESNTRWILSINRIKILRYHIVWILHHGYWPIELDHKDRDPLNDKIENLREANQSQNSINSKIPITNTSGYKGVALHKPSGTWRAYIGKNNKQIHLGLFDTLGEAISARRKAELHYYGEFATDGT